MNFHKSGSTGLIITIVGGALLGAAFLLAYNTYSFYLNEIQNNFNAPAAGFISNLNNLLEAAIVVMFLGIMGWVGSVFLLRGVDFMKVDRGVGVVTFKVDKGVGVVSGVQVTTTDAKKPENQVLDLTKQEKS